MWYNKRKTPKGGDRQTLINKLDKKFLAGYRPGFGVFSNKQLSLVLGGFTMELKEIEVGKEYIVEMDGEEEVVEVTKVKGEKVYVTDDDGDTYKLKISAFVKVVEDDDDEKEKPEAGDEGDVLAKLEDIEDQLEELAARIGKLEKGRKAPAEVVTEVQAEKVATEEKKGMTAKERRAARKQERQTATAGNGNAEVDKLLKDLKKAKDDGDQSTARKLRKELRKLGYSARGSSNGD